MSNNRLIGRSLGSFKIKSLLGRGGMADVYFGWDVKLHRDVAIKVFEVRNRANASQANRFIQEARVMAKWRHDNIVQIYSAGDETGLLYYVMEFIDGYDLASIMSVYAEQGELMPITDVLRIGEAMAGALDYAHEQGVIHRDVKPANVMIANEDGRVVLGDFGLALDLRDKSRGEVFGSPHYISPEQARRSSDAVPQSDLYSLGVILYEMLTGATPFSDPSPATLALQHLTEPPPRPRALNPALSEEVESVLLKALEKNPTDRYQSGRDLMSALSAALTSQPVKTPMNAPPLPPIPVGAPTIQRSRVSMNSFTKRGDVISALEKRTTAARGLPDEEFLGGDSSKKGPGWLVVFALVLLALLMLGYVYRPSIFSLLSQVPLSASPPVQVTETQISTLALGIEGPTQTVTIPTSTPTASQTSVPSATVTSTQTLLPTATTTHTPTITPANTSSTPTVLYPNGYWMSAYYNKNSFYLFDHGGASRSVSGFSFDRISDDGTFQNHFGGWEWGKYSQVIQPNWCVSLEVYLAPDPYLNPSPCQRKMLSRLSLSMKSDKLFWTPADTSHEFRVLWLNEEVARCEIAAGTCNIYVP